METVLVIILLFGLIFSFTWRWAALDDLRERVRLLEDTVLKQLYKHEK